MSNDRVLELLVEAYFDELETMMNYIAVSENLETVAGEEVAESFSGDVADELGHAQRLAARIHVLGGDVPVSAEFEPDQIQYQTLGSRDVEESIEAAIAAEQDAQEVYRDLIEAAVSFDDPVTEDLAIELLEDEEGHERELRDLLAEFQ